ncbi:MULTISPECIES: hypothetical protein [Protofrankia]|uniref:Uncharacterized protein n=1 Tax=Protofrankia coriariae TaxID=1562887 RepID=A0ABR5F1Q0_9ACTN|nr:MULTISPECIES: hypothetical protein [Protofrankia]KLL10578.1 hypothetical protein FrCorBMG51_17070 [Protofrankia coriariae]ONH34144.1 hypothetical protein BL254_17690 [Protofrankia sp. BMG5.30]
MHEARNLGWADTPFGASRRPFPERMPLLAAVAVAGGADDPPMAVGAVYLRLPRACPLLVSDAALRFGFHALAVDDPAEIPAVVAMVDGLLVQARRRAVILAGHRLADDLARLAAAADGRPLRGITAVAAAWQDGASGRGLARLLDTSHGPHPTPATLPAVCAGYRLTGIPPDHDPATPGRGRSGSAGPAAAPDPLGQVLVRALAIALIAARVSGHYQWDDDLHLDTIVEAAAWDQTPATAGTEP